LNIELYAGLAYWKSASGDVRLTVQKMLMDLVAQHGVAFVSSFYEAFLHHEDGRAFLNHDVVQNRLSSSMLKWLTEVVSVDLSGDLTEFAAAQARVGSIHGRMKVPNHLVHQGASQLKSHMSRLLAEQTQGDAALMAASIIILDECLDFSLCLMGKAYVMDAQERAQTDEAFRHFSLGQDINLERETQRAALMEWSQSALFNLFGNPGNHQPQKLSASAFGLWMRHRAGMLFQDIATLGVIEAAIEAVDRDCLPHLTAGPDGSAALMQLKERIEEISFLLTNLFKTASAVENGRDPLTRTLSRRFLPSVLNREIMMSKSHEIPLCVAMVDIDHFKQVNDQHGHSVGDVALGHVADLLLKSVRSNDFVFRYGGEEFLIVFPETSGHMAYTLVERLRLSVEQSPVSIGNGGEIRISVSAGIAQFEGHPDYDYLIRNADAALYEAKRGGRNQVSMKA
jgi:diguanylate cyclase